MTRILREPDHTHAYRAAARRLRARHASDPVRLHRSLRALSDRVDRIRPRRTASPAPHAHHPPGPAESFAVLVTARMDGPVLRYSQRAALIRQALTMGVGRFEANLIIAAVEHRARGNVPAPSRSRATVPALIPALLVALCAQSLIVVFAWWIVG